MWPFSSKEPAAPAAPAAADVRDATAPPATENSPTEYLRSHSFETPSAAAAPPAEAPTAAGLLRNTALDPARLHPFADIKDDLEYLDIEDDRPNQIAGARTALPSRGWSDDLCYGTGTTYLGGLLVGSMMGLREGLTRPLGIESPTFRLRMNAVLNQVTRRGTFIGNSAGVIALTYNIFDATIDAVRGVHDIYGSVASGAIAGALFRCTSLIVGTALASLAVALLDVKVFLPLHVHPHLSVYHQYWQLATYHWAFTNSSELLLGALLFHYAGRDVERALGTRKMAVLVPLVAALHAACSVVWGAASAAAIAHSPVAAHAGALIGDPARWASGYLPAGPFGVLGALGGVYFALIPPLWTLRVGALELTNRMLVGVPLLLGPFSAVAVLEGWLLSRLYLHPWGRLGSMSAWRVPYRVAAWMRRVAVPLVGSTQLPVRTSRAQYRRDPRP